MDRIEPVCGKCGDFVYIPDGYDFEDGDLCHDCLQKAYDEQRARTERLRKALEDAFTFVEALRFFDLMPKEINPPDMDAMSAVLAEAREKE